MTPLMELVRGTDQRAGPDGSPEQEALKAELREEGLEEPEIDFWCSHALTVQAVLGYLVSKGVEVKVLIWASNEHFSHCDPEGGARATQPGRRDLPARRQLPRHPASPHRVACIKKWWSWTAPTPLSAASIC